MSSFPPSAQASHTDLAHPIHELLAERWSPRAFDPARAIREAEVKQLFEAARWAPSSFNGQPWRYLYAHRGAESFSKLLGVLSPFNQAWAAQAGLLILGVAKTSVEGREAPNAYARYDLGAANFALTVQAQAMGLYVHQMAGFDRAQAREAFGIPADHDPVVVLAVGGLGDPAQLPEQLREREIPRKPRLPQESLVFPLG
ncbi:MAG: nitroreductase [Bacteroidetes bacterium]|nr:MAG: nitroreductase [Bacteroidota bacterium]